MFIFAELMTLNAVKISVESKEITVSSQMAVRELQKYLNRIVVNTDDSKPITIILSIESKQSIGDGYRIRYHDGVIYIIGDNERSLLYGVYGFLEALGCRFLAPDYEVIPSTAKLDFSKIEKHEQARFEYREIFIKESDNESYAIKNRLNGRLGHRNKGKNPLFVSIDNSYSPFAVVSKAYEKLYPNYFCGGQLDYALPALQVTAADEFRSQIIRKKPSSVDIAYLSHVDNQFYCTSAQSRQLIERYRSPSAPFIDYGARLARSIPASSGKVFTEAYLWSRKPPVGYPKLPSNMGIFFSDIEADFAKPLNHPENRAILDDLNGWSKITDQVYVWHYTTNFSGYLQPFPDLDATAKNIAIFDKTPALKGVFLQGAYETTGSDFAAMRVWVYGKLLWNPSLDTDKLIAEFCQLYYGGAGDNVIQYINLMEQSIQSVNTPLRIKMAPNSPYLNRKVIEQARSILNEGMSKVGKNPIYVKHFTEVVAGLDYVELMQGSLDGDGRKRFQKYIRERNIKAYAEGGKIGQLAPYLTSERKLPSAPTSVILPQSGWKDIQEYAMKLCCSELVSDPKASDGFAVRMEGKRSDWGIQLDIDTLPPGKWKIYATVRIDKAPGISVTDYIRPAIFYGIHGKNIKDGKLISSMEDEAYHEVLVGSVNVQNNDTAALWIRPPANDVVKYIYVDRLFAIPVR